MDENYSEEQFQYDSDAGNWAGGGIDLTGSVWETIAELNFDNTANVQTTANTGGGYFDFLDGVSFGGVLKSVSSVGDAVTASAGVLGKVSGQLSSAKSVFQTSKNAVTGATDWAATLAAWFPYIALGVGAVVVYKYAKD